MILLKQLSNMKNFCFSRREVTRKILIEGREYSEGQGAPENVFKRAGLPEKGWKELWRGAWNLQRNYDRVGRKLKTHLFLFRINFLIHQLLAKS